MKTVDKIKGWEYLIQAEDYVYGEKIEMKVPGKNKPDAVKWFKQVCGGRFCVTKIERGARVSLRF